MTGTEHDGTSATLTPALVEGFSKEFDKNAINRIKQNVLAETPVAKVALNHSVAAYRDHTFSNVLDDWSVTDQKRSGRCWIFAGLNLLRVGAMKKMNLKSFEFSQNYITFWDKFEKANHFLEAIIETASLPIDDRTVLFLNGAPIIDGGQWDMFVNVVKKHGVVPNAAMPETESSSETAGMNKTLVAKLRIGAKKIRDAHAGSATLTALRSSKAETLKSVYDILRMHLGDPPQDFRWQWTDDKKKFHRETFASPKEFAEKYITVPLDEYISLVHDPRQTSPYGRTFTVEHLGNVVEYGTVKYLNVNIELMKDLAMQTILGGEPVWFGCDAGKMFHRDKSILDADLYDYEGFYDTDLELRSKEDRLLYSATAMNHAMLFTGIDVEDAKPVQWRIENSWGEKGEAKGFYLMKDSWFNEHMFEIATRKSSLPDDLQKAFEEEPIVHAPWDPMGSLA